MHKNEAQPEMSTSPELKTAPASAVQSETEDTSFLGYLREWGDALVIAFVVAMFIRMFVVELFKIPSGSMSPTLLGDWVAEGAASNQEGESHQYLLIIDPMETVQVFEMGDDGHYNYEGKQSRYALTASQQVLLQSNVHREEHRILVNKFAYWFKQPDRGDIVIFRVPFKSEPYVYARNGARIPGPIYNRNESVYVKRAVAFGGEEVEVRPDQHLYINGQQVTEPEIISKLQYIIPQVSPEYDITVPQEHLVVLGDNSDNSLDSRYWGPLPENNLRGKAVVRYWPFKDKWFLNP